MTKKFKQLRENYIGKNVTLQALANSVTPFIINNVDGQKQFDIQIDRQ